MTDEPRGPVPARRSVSADELDRVIRRAVELQYSAADRDGGGEVDEAEVIRIGQEVGISAEHVRRALGELRAEALMVTAPDEGGLLHRVGGSGFVQASRVIPREAAAVEAALDEHLREGEALAPIRKRAGRSLWEPAGGFMAQLERGLSLGGRTFDLAKAKSLEVVTSPLEDGYTLVSLTADVRNLRGETVGGWMTGLGVSGGAAGTALGFVFLNPIVGIPGVLLGVALGTYPGRHYYRAEVDRTRTVLEGLLDRLETGEGLHRKANRPSWRKHLGI